MTPPICELCGKDFRSRWVNTGQGGVRIGFADNRDVWFCDEHAEVAQKLNALSSDMALKRLRQTVSADDLSHPKAYGPIPDPQLCIIKAGPSIAKVITIIAEATGLTTQETVDLIKQKKAPAIDGPYPTLQSYKKRLDQNGATSQILFNDQAIPPLDPLLPSILSETETNAQKRLFPETSKSLPLTWFLVVLLVSILVGYFFDIWWVTILFVGFILAGFVSIVVRWKLEN